MIKKENLPHLTWIIIQIMAGSVIMAAGYVYFLTPQKITPGGIVGIATIIHYQTADIFALFPNGLPVGALSLLFNIPLAALGFKVLGRRFGTKTIAAFSLTSLSIDILTFFYGDPHMPLVDDRLLSTVFGGLLVGWGVGFIFRSGGSVGGTSIIAAIINHVWHVSRGNLVMIMDGFIVIFAFFAFGDWALPLYALITVFITRKAIDSIIEGNNYYRTMFIVSEKHRIIQRRLISMKRTGTSLLGEGIYSRQSRRLLCTVVNRREEIALMAFINRVDPNAFVTVMNSNTFGRSFIIPGK